MYDLHRQKLSSDIDIEVEEMKKEIALYGPIGCAIESHAPGFYYDYTGGIYDVVKEEWHLSHEITVVGYGVDEETGVEYWVAKNSWGSHWGDQGYFKTKMGINSLGMEEDCNAGYASYTKNIQEKTE